MPAYIDVLMPLRAFIDSDILGKGIIYGDSKMS